MASIDQTNPQDVEREIESATVRHQEFIKSIEWVHELQRAENKKEPHMRHQRNLMNMLIENKREEFDLASLEVGPNVLDDIYNSVVDTATKEHAEYIGQLEQTRDEIKMYIAEREFLVLFEIPIVDGLIGYASIFYINIARVEIFAST